jgi:hypothetical protein
MRCMQVNKYIVTLLGVSIMRPGVCQESLFSFYHSIVTGRWRWVMGDGRWVMGDGRCDGRWAMGDGRWAMGDGR